MEPGGAVFVSQATRKEEKKKAAASRLGRDTQLVCQVSERRREGSLPASCFCAKKGGGTGHQEGWKKVQVYSSRPVGKRHLGEVGEARGDQKYTLSSWYGKGGRTVKQTPISYEGEKNHFC